MPKSTALTMPMLTETKKLIRPHLRTEIPVEIKEEDEPARALAV